ncbi:Protein kinase domain-containing protein [Forsythia ovata]|uniref:Protein kinase domain-containing protein n=1 Tax=Forsythia ovata TaxID=205694 RepID=A0ABD1WTA0_9LAMI
MHTQILKPCCTSNQPLLDLQAPAFNVLLRRALPPEIGLLNKLVNLSLVSTNLTCELPAEMENLTSLKFVNLTTNFFKGTFPREILLTMHELKVFDVYSNNFSGKLHREFVRIDLKFQESVSLDVANAIVSKLRFHLDPFRVVMDEKSPLKEKYVVQRLADKMSKYKKEQTLAERKRSHVTNNIAKVVNFQ